MLPVNRLGLCVMLAIIVVLGAAAISSAVPPPNPLHPTFQLLDEHGKIIRQAGIEPDQEKTCGQCHDTAFITGHAIPAHQQKNISCLSCHFECDKALECGKVAFTAEAFEPDGMLKRQWLRISKPAAANCGTCHGLTTPPDGPVAIPRNYPIAAYPGTSNPGVPSIDPQPRGNFLRSGSLGISHESCRQTKSPLPLGCACPESNAVHRLPLCSQQSPASEFSGQHRGLAPGRAPAGKVKRISCKSLIIIS